MWLVAAFYTKATQYENHARNLIESLKEFKLPYEITPIDNLGDWYKNMQFKPTFLKQMLEKYHPHSIVYVDVDAVFYRYPALFDQLDRMPNLSVGVHILDHSKYRRRNHPPELLSGTIFLKNNQKTSIIINEWIEECKKDSRLWDQRALASVLREKDFYVLPEEYCTIFDYMSSVKYPVIKHFQASRVERNASKKPQANSVRVIRKAGCVRNGRFHHKRK